MFGGHRFRLGASRALAGVAIALALGASPAMGGEPSEADIARAKQAFNEGKELESKNQWSQALEKFREVAGVKMTPHVRFHIALCEENLGRFVSAINGFELAAAEAQKMGKGAEQVAENAPTRAEALRRRVASLRIEVQGHLVTSRVLLDQKEIARSQFGALIYVDPGAHVIEVDAGSGDVSERREVTLAEKGYETITLTIDDKDPVLPTATATSTATAPTATSTATAPPPSRVPVFVAGGVGIAAGIGAGVMYGLRVSSLSSFEALCPAQGSDVRNCPIAAQAPYKDAQAFTIASGVLLGVGVAGLATAGVLWFVTAPPKVRPSTGKVGVGVTPNGVIVGGSF